MNTKDYLIAIVFLLLTGLSGCKKDKDDNDTPTPTPTPTDTTKPIAAFSFTCGACQAPCVVAFSNASQHATSYVWEFGNGQTSVDKNPSPTYNAGGVYVVKLTAINDNGSDTATTSVTLAYDPAVGLTYLNEDFETQTNNFNITINGWSNVNVSGARHWIGYLNSGNLFAKVSAYLSFAPVMETWLVTPKLNLAVADTLTFRTQQGYWVHDGLTVWFSNDYNGSNISAATWWQITCPVATLATGQFVWLNSGDIPLSAFSGSGYVGFKYVGGDPGLTTEFDVDDVVVH